MPLERVELPEGQVRIEAVRGGRFIVAGEARAGAFAIWPEGIVEVEARGIDTLGERDFEPLLSLAPPRDVLLIGSGAHMAWPDFSLLDRLRERFAGVDVMDSRAAARTYNLLMSEHRLVGALILPLR